MRVPRHIWENLKETLGKNPIKLAESTEIP